MDEAVVHDRRTDVMLAATRAASMLKFLLAHGHIPAHHASHVREIVDAHTDARAAWEKAIGIAEVANG